MVQQMMPMDIDGTKQTVQSNRRQFKHIGKLKDDEQYLPDITLPIDIAYNQYLYNQML